MNVNDLITLVKEGKSADEAIGSQMDVYEYAYQVRDTQEDNSPQKPIKYASGQVPEPKEDDKEIDTFDSQPWYGKGGVTIRNKNQEDMTKEKSNTQKMIESVRGGQSATEVVEQTSPTLQEEYTPDVEYAKMLSRLGKLTDAADALKKEIVDAGDYDGLVSNKERIKTCLAELSEKFYSLEGLRYGETIHVREM